MTTFGAAVAAGCGGGDDSSFPNGSDGSADGTTVFGDGSVGPGFGGDGGGSDAKSDAPNNAGPLVISPAAPVVTVTRDMNGGTKVSLPTEVDFTATFGGSAVAPIWSIDRAELGAIATSGAFVAKGELAGSAQITATYGTSTAMVPVVVKIVATENGGNGAVDGGVQDGGPGGYEGVGGKGPGTPVSGAQASSFATATPVAPSTIAQTTYFPDAGADAAPYDAGNAQSFEFLYPYDKTVFPLGILPPLLQWRSTVAASTVAVDVKLSEANYSFEGQYAYPAPGAAGFTDDDRSRQPISEAVWHDATYSNGGSSDPLKVEIKILTSDGTVYGPITEQFTIAQGVLTGTVYYNSYKTSLNGSQGAVLAIQPGASAPTLAIPAEKGQCHVCHSVAGDGKTLFVQDNNYDYGSSYDLTDGGALIQHYYGADAGDGTTQVGKF
ncbi:MAG TPA: hypothetical protein VF407_14550, partial [Polyangiaceae bacterium]